ncbi:senescence-induced receptor-like serine/threonine-protein kinase [Quercus suber]|uniref:senescence-induced receptor-like serine/threonine-protein kinase n=1 Tax=Quercus suber TaxID=58331 RepID=UPI0032DE3D7C
MPIKIIMDYTLELIFVLKAWRVVVLVIGILGNWKLAEGDNEHAGRKLVDHVPGFISIDCGATKDYADEGTGIFYRSDTDFIDTGTNSNISPEDQYSNHDYGRQIANLRSFPQGKKNCYTLKPEQGKNSNYLINFIFYYGNYDNKNKTPRFDVYVGVDFVYTLELDPDEAETARLFDVIHVPTSDIIYICFINTGSGIPFISALELRPSDKSLYPFNFGKLKNGWRYDLGTTTGYLEDFIRAACFYWQAIQALFRLGDEVEDHSHALAQERDKFLEAANTLKRSEADLKKATEDLAIHEKGVAEYARDEAVRAKDEAVFAKIDAERSMEKAEEDAFAKGVAKTEAILRAQVPAVCRYKNDVYDRFWYTSNPLSNSVPINTSSVIDIQNNNDSYQIPSEVLRTAVQPSSGYHSLSFSDMSGYTQESYVCFHFAEIAKLTQGKKREFIINVKEGSYISEPVTLDYLKPLSICLNQTFEWPFSFVIKATTASDLPPILNAFEVYGVIPQYELHKPTNSRDVAAIMDIKQTLRIFREDWLADPCVPIELTWSGLTCNSSDDTPMIISLNLSSSKLTGEIPFSLSNLTALQYLDLSYNELTGSVPKFLAQLPNLKTLNLSGNQLNGLIPEDLIQKSRDGSLVFGSHYNYTIFKRSAICPLFAREKFEKIEIYRRTRRSFHDTLI